MPSNFPSARNRRLAASGAGGAYLSRPIVAAAELIPAVPDLGRNTTGADRDLFERQLAPWIGRFFEDLEHAKSAEFYARVGTLGRVFMAIEMEAFTIQT